MRTLLTLTILIALTSIARAQDNRIIVINPDGSVSEIDIGPSTVAPKKESAEKPRAVESAPAPAAKPAKKPAPQKQAVKKEAPAKKQTPAKKPAAPKQKKEAAASKQKQAAPAKRAPDMAPARVPEAPMQQRLGPAMTPEDAIRIALDVAPPSRSVTASAVNYKGLHAYEVLFKTEDGDRAVYVDRESGRIVK